MSYEDQDYHRRRSEAELEQAVSADAPESAIPHLELARMHRARRQVMAEQESASPKVRRGGGIFRTDKEA